jgi:hypothetical protein
MADMTGAIRSGDAQFSLLGIYLNDHLAGATAGIELFRRAARAHATSPIGVELQQLAAEVEADRDALRDIMASLAVPVRRYKLATAWAVEKAARLKRNGHVLSRSPLSSLIELEALRLGVQGKAAGWRTLRELADTDARLDRKGLDELQERAHRQADRLEALRLTTAAAVFHRQP